MKAISFASSALCLRLSLLLAFAIASVFAFAQTATLTVSSAGPYTAFQSIQYRVVIGGPANSVNNSVELFEVTSTGAKVGSPIASGYVANEGAGVRAVNLTSSLLGAGSKFVKAFYLGSANSNPAESGILPLNINKAVATISLSNLNHTYDGGAKSATATTNPSGLTGLAITYNGSAIAPINAGSYAVQATLTNDNYQATPATGTLVIDKATATIHLSNLCHVYNGSGKTATATTTPANLNSVTITYNGGSTAPVNAGSYAVVATLDNENYEATPASGSLTIEKASQVITFNQPTSPKKFGDGPLTLTATSNSGLPVSFTATENTDWLSANTVTFPANGASNVTFSVSASQEGNENYLPAVPITRSIEVLENSAPSITAAASPQANGHGWNNSSVSVTLSGADNEGGSGINALEYRVNLGSAIQALPDSEGKLTLPAFTSDSEYTIYFKAIDKAGNTSSEGNIEVKIDTVAPSGTATGPDPDRTDEDGRKWYRTQRTVSFSGSDDRSGIDGDANVQMDTISAGQSGFESLFVTFHDKAGNAGIVEFQYYFDSVAPVIGVEGTSNGAYLKSIEHLNVSVTDAFLRDDQTQIELTRRATMSDTEQSYPFTNGMTLDQDGIYKLTINAIDAAGNSSSQELEFTVLNSLPKITVNSPAAGWHNVDQLLDYNAKNAVMATIGFVLQQITNLPGAPLATLSGSIIAMEGRYELNLTAEDQAGNSSSLTHTFEIDKTAPVANAMATGVQGIAPWYVDPNGVDVNIGATDQELKEGVAGSGVKEIHWYATGAGQTASAASPNVIAGGAAHTTVTANGTTTIHFWAVDEAGNASSEQSIEVKLDNVAPEIGSLSNIGPVDATSRDGATVAYSAATATDNLNQPVTISYSKESGDQYAIGNTVVTVTATDEAGNQDVDTFTVTVKRPVPTITSITSSVTTYAPGVNTIITVHGSGIFDDSKIKFGGVEYVVDPSSTFGTATITSPLGDAGEKSAKLITPASLLGNDGGESDTVTFEVAKAAATMTLGTLGFTYDGSPKPVMVTTDPATLTGVSITYDGSNTAPTNAGSYAVVVHLDNINYEAEEVTGTLEIAKAEPTVNAVGGTFTYDGNAKEGSGSAKGVNSEDLSPAVTLSYSSGQAPVDAGSYTVTAQFAGNENYLPGSSESATITIEKAQATLTLENLTHTYNGTPQAASVSTSPTGLTGVSIKYNGSSTVPTNAGTYTVDATLDNPNYWANPVSGSMSIAKANATVLLSNLTHVYDGLAKAATATTAPEGLVVNLQYDPASPTNAGVYAVTATVDDQNYQGEAIANLTIAKAPQTITFPAPTSNVEIGLTANISATGGASGNPVTFSLAGPGTLDGNTVTVTGIGGIVITANQAGNENYEDATPIVRTINGIYSWSGLLAPINASGNSVFKLGSTIPVKFRLTGGSAGVTNGVFRLYGSKISNGVAGEEQEVSSTSNADSGNTFRYSDGQYIFNLSTKSLSEGTWQLRIDLGDNVLRTVNIALKK